MEGRKRKRLKGCICKDSDWRIQPPPICGRYRQTKTCCKNCEHEMECHKRRASLRESLLADAFDEGAWNAIREVLCRVHPKGAEAIFNFQEWFEIHKKEWISPWRACGTWLRKQLKRSAR